MLEKTRLSAEELVAYAEYIANLPRFDITPAEAAPLLGCNQYSLNVSAKQGHLGSIEHFFAGNNLRLSKASVLKFIGYNKDDFGGMQNG